MFSSVSGVSFYRYDEEMEAKYIARRLMSYGLPATGDLTTDKHVLKRVESGEAALPVVSSQGTETQQLTSLENERSGAEQLGILMKLRLGLI